LPRSSSAAGEKKPGPDGKCVLLMPDKEILDTAMIAAAQAVEHYETARYGLLIAWARQLGLD